MDFLKEENDVSYTKLPYSVRAAILQQLGLKPDDSRFEGVFIDAKMQQDIELNEKFKYMIISKSMIDEYETKKYSLSRPPIQKKNHLEHIRKKAVALKSDKIHKDPCSHECNEANIFACLAKACKEEEFRIVVPQSILIGFGLNSPMRIWTDSDGLLKSEPIDWNNLLHYMDMFDESNESFNCPTYVLKTKSLQPEDGRCCSYVEFFKKEESNEVYSRLHKLSYKSVSCLLQQFIRPKGNCASKLRVHFTNEFQKGYLIFSRSPFTHSKNSEKSLKEFIPQQFLNSSISFNLHSSVYQEMFKLKPFQPLTNHTNFFEDNHGKLNFLRQCSQVANFMYMVAQIISVSIIDYDQKEFAHNMIRFFRAKIKKLADILSNEFNEKNKLSNNAHSRSGWSSKFTVKVSESEDIDVYEVLSNKKFISCTIVWSEAKKCLKKVMQKNQTISSIVLDFIEAIDGNFYLINAPHIVAETVSCASIPVFSDFKHISLFSATESSSVSKGKKQLVCCGDYCKLLKRNDYENREKIELLMKHNMEYAGTLFELMQLQDILNIDTLQHLLGKDLRPQTPITEHLQYKILRKTILEDRNDKYSLKSLINNLPNKLLRELDIKLQRSKDTEAINLYIQKQNNNYSKASLNKKLAWEFELVPVCDKCYKIYSRRDKKTKEKYEKFKEEMLPKIHSSNKRIRTQSQSLEASQFIDDSNKSSNYGNYGYLARPRGNLLDVTIQSPMNRLRNLSYEDLR
ncbi:unnamed protein product [Blepharisma stoltei]|uniref:Uncharacterized protein n=1 Tax=Blepharisma stoltei TaxID=1481888 RepID=A0AAU9KAG2_9CILI|nr:unnamed protein product [Blepharisma stoltei]